mmetsp:Transcript_84575/g.225890  ORF Transcript_84575/g.225890 Transcript_84575/m.225890 type:complete len:142 (-) Transcript_84575:182-607(-)|eukprot:CAMPEP_0113699666 /NCGR_PEP_ID=MMETSP0038_2-20120614/23468_1 /TAXON_ID=2898 /ORGANISM="Cryptomonas paramecium" /LENGTH=141 /DNA_ID=CAMNT_0000623117 /DNA_START=31 /DNA_END=456 /DNA_ORIENTATION=- /assembly_acc=CAM_ASM_000170
MGNQVQKPRSREAQYAVSDEDVKNSKQAYDGDCLALEMHPDSASVFSHATTVNDKSQTASVANKSLVSDSPTTIEFADLRDFRSPGIARTPLLERRNTNHVAALHLAKNKQLLGDQLFADPRSPTVPRSPVPTTRPLGSTS